MLSTPSSWHPDLNLRQHGDSTYLFEASNASFAATSMLGESATLIAEYAVRTWIVTLHPFVRQCVILALHLTANGLNEAKPSSFLSRSFRLQGAGRPGRSGGSYQGRCLGDKSDKTRKAEHVRRAGIAGWARGMRSMQSGGRQAR